MRLLITADLHYNHAHSRPLADELIDRMNSAGGDVLLVVGDTAAADGDALERCLQRFRFTGPKLFVAGNHELWTARADSSVLFAQELPARIRALGWHWLETDPFVAGDIAIVGTIGWYDYSFAEASLGIPKRFYARKISPGAAERFAEHADLFNPCDDISAAARKIIARWNDGRYVKLGMSDEAFLDQRLAQLEANLHRVADAKQIVAAVHHLPFASVCPSSHRALWDFTKAYLGSEKIGHLLLNYPNLSTVYCGHSHLPVEARIGTLYAINIGSGYRWKTFRELTI
jgi:predicted phosphodiesterase